MKGTFSNVTCKIMLANYIIFKREIMAYVRANNPSVKVIPYTNAKKQNTPPTKLFILRVFLTAMPCTLLHMRRNPRLDTPAVPSYGC